MGQRINVHPDRGPVSVTAIRFLGQITESNIQTTYSGTSTNSVSIAASLFKSEMCISAHFYPGLPKTCCLSKPMKETGEVRQFAVEAKNTVWSYLDYAPSLLPGPSVADLSLTN